MQKAVVADVLEALAEAASRLWFPSESDAPLTPYLWPGARKPTPGALLRAEGHPPGTPVEIVKLEELFDALTAPRPGATDTARWRALVDLLETHLEGLRVYRIGAVDVDAYVLGRHRSGAWLGLKTHLVET